MSTIHFILTFLVIGAQIIQNQAYEDETPILRKTFTNDFIFKLWRENISDNNITVVLHKAEELGFVYHSRMLGSFLIFTRDDVKLLSPEAYDVAELTNAQIELSEYVESIEQDYERSWLADSEVKQYAKIQESISGRRMSSRRSSQINQISQSSRSSQSHLSPHTEKLYKHIYLSPCNVAFIDIGFELDHPELKDSVDARLSHNFFTGSTNVLPDLYGDDMKHSYPGKLYLDVSHGTMCLGCVGSNGRNGCGEGVAPHVKLVGLKAVNIGGYLSDKREALALSYNHDNIDVIACCYGIRDNIGFFGPQNLSAASLLNGATKSRDCQGVVYIYPSGNGHLDNCNADGYANSVNTITVASVNRNGDIVQDGEVCSAAMASAVGEGFNTSTLNGLCSDAFKGSSAACAVVAGFVGELKYINPCLSKRDIEHIMVKSCYSGQVKDWRENGAGIKFNDYIGFGQLNLTEMKDIAKQWKYVPDRHICEIDPPDKSDKHMSGTHWTLTTEIPSDACRDKHKINYLEHVQVRLSLRCNHVSNVAIQLISPAHTVSNILTTIKMSAHNEKKHRELNWTFMSVNFWRENGEGLWTVKVFVENAPQEVECEYHVIKLVLYGTEGDPDFGTNQPTTCKVEQSKDEHQIIVPFSTIFIIIAVVVIAIVIFLCIYKEEKGKTSTGGK